MSDTRITPASDTREEIKERALAYWQEVFTSPKKRSKRTRRVAAGKYARYVEEDAYRG